MTTTSSSAELLSGRCDANKKWSRRNRRRRPHPCRRKMFCSAGKSHRMTRCWAYFQHSSGAIEVSRLNLDSPALRRLKDEGVAVIVPLVSQGELVGIINLGQRRSDQQNPSDDRRLLDDLAVQAALRARGVLVRQKEAGRGRARAHRDRWSPVPSSRRCCPRNCPPAAGWEIAADWQPAREVSGDFYDFIHLDDGRWASSSPT